MPEHDPLEGFRALTPEQLEAQLRERLQEHDFLVDFWQMGERMSAYLETPHGAFIVKTFRDEFNEHLAALLECPDPTTDDARKHHFEARTRWKLLELIEATITSGLEAEGKIIEQDKVTP